MAAPDRVTEWHPARLVRDARRDVASDQALHQEPFALIVLNQPLDHLAVVSRLWRNSFIRVAADGGANRLQAAAKTLADGSLDNLDVIIGDLDSLTESARAYFKQGSNHTEIIHDEDQYSTDFGKAVRYVREHNPVPVDIVALGGLGGRVDQGLSQLHHLYMFQTDSEYSAGRIYLVSEESITFLLKTGTHHIQVRDGGEEVFAKHVGILPIKEKSIITTKGLEWDVTDWVTEFGGQMSTSNHVLPETRTVEVTTTKDVLFTIALMDLE